VGAVIKVHEFKDAAELEKILSEGNFSRMWLSQNLVVIDRPNQPTEKKESVIVNMTKSDGRRALITDGETEYFHEEKTISKEDFEKPLEEFQKADEAKDETKNG
jgi:hypothetical protein